MFSLVFNDVAGCHCWCPFRQRVSPAVFFYSRYYIQEMLLVCFTFGAIVGGYQYARTKALSWALVAGVFVGLMRAVRSV